MIRKYDLPGNIKLKCGAVLFPVFGGYIGSIKFLPMAGENGWLGKQINSHEALVVEEAKKRKLKYRMVSVLSRNLRGKTDLHHRPYRPNIYVFVEVKKQFI